MQPGFSLPLSRVPWNVFGTLTFKGDSAPGESAQVREALRFFDWVAHLGRIRRQCLLWALRLENGEAGGRLHIHPLIVVQSHLLGFFAVPRGARSVASKVWRRGGRRRGIAVFRKIQGVGDPAVTYIEKDVDGGADLYELAKTGRASRLLVSNAALRMIRGRQQQGRSIAGR